MLQDNEAEVLQDFLFKKRHEETTTMMMTAAHAALHKCKNTTGSSQTSGVTCQEPGGAEFCWLTGDSAARLV